MNQSELNKILDEGFGIWTEMVGFDPDQRMFKSGELDIRNQAREIQEARLLDITGITAFMLMKALAKVYIETEKVSALSVIAGFSEEQQARLDILKKMYFFLQRDEVDETIQGFLGSVRDATAHYGVEADSLNSWLDSYYWMATIRRDALKAFKKLEAHQFYHGKSGDSDRLTYGTKVMEFWNIPSLVRAMKGFGERGMRGIHLCLIRDPELPLSSYFVIAVVNGESLTILTDRTKQPHPLSKHMKAMRRPSKEFEERAGSYWFPYELLDLAANEQTGDVWAKARETIVPINAQAVSLRDFSLLHPADAIFLSLLFGLLGEKYLVNNEQHSQLSYTTEMIRHPHLLETGSAIVEKSTYQPLAVEDLKQEDVTAESTAAQWEREAVGHNEWLIEAYQHLVPVEALNLIGTDERKALPPIKIESFSVQDCSIRTMDPLDFGTKERLDRERLWVARFNQCKIIDRIAHERFKEEEAAVRQWLHEKLLAREDWLIEQAVRGELVVQAPRGRQFSILGEQEGGTMDVDLITLRVGSRWTNLPGPVLLGKRIRFPEWEAGDTGPRCAVTGAKKTTYHVAICPYDADSLALILGCKKEEMPWQLQHWHSKTEPFYTGNSILDRLDPSDWVITSPWAGGHSGRFPIGVHVHLSKRAVNRMRKERALPKMNWKKPEHEAW